MSKNVREVVCEKTGRRFHVTSWHYATGIVTIDSTKDLREVKKNEA